MSKRQETKEKKQLEKFKKMLAKPDYKGYFFVMIGLVILFQLFDGMATGIFGTLQEAVVKDFAGLPFDAVHAAGNLCAGLLILPFSKLLRRLNRTIGIE